VVAVLVIIEAVMLIDNMTKVKGTPVVTENKTVENPQQPQPDVNMVLTADKSEVAVGKPVLVTVELTDKSSHKIDGIEAYVKYDVSAFDISQMTYSDKLSAPDVAMNSTKKGLVLVNYLISNPADGYLLDSTGLKVLSFVATPKAVGEFEFKIDTSKENTESVSIVAEHAQEGNVPKSLPLASNKLTVRVVAK
jgi:hypothetical protein